jgi:hypothetical protein
VADGASVAVDVTVAVTVDVAVISDVGDISVGLGGEGSVMGGIGVEAVGKAGAITAVSVSALATWLATISTVGNVSRGRLHAVRNRRSSVIGTYIFFMGFILNLNK